MVERIVDIATNGLHLSTHRGFMLVAKDGEEQGRIPLDDIHALILHAHGVTWSGTLAARLAERGAPVIFCNTSHMPVAVTLPLEGHYAQNARMQAQWSVSKPLCKQLWRRIVQAKVRMQGALLEARGADGAVALHHMANRVKSGDTDNIEAQAARRYWPLLMGADFRRDRDASGTNALLNYGYAVMRATVARAIIAAGLHPTIGIHHAHRGNAFALADDLIEPFRPLVDAVAITMAQEGVESLTPDIKQRFARLIAYDIRIDDAMSPISVAAQRLATSLAQCFETGTVDLALCDPPQPIDWAALTKASQAPVTQVHNGG